MTFKKGACTVHLFCEEVPLVVDHCTVDDESRHYDKTPPFVSPGSDSTVFYLG